MSQRGIKFSSGGNLHLQLSSALALSEVGRVEISTLKEGATLFMHVDRSIYACSHRPAKLDI